MEELTFSLLNIPTVLVFLSVFLLCYLCLRSRSNLPPGPTGLPFIGHVLWIKKKYGVKLHKLLFEASKTYGDVILLNFVGQRFLFLQGYDTIRDAFVKNADVLSDRPFWLCSLKEPLKEGKGVLFQSGKEWKVIRKFVLQTLKDFGVGKTSLEEKVMQEVDAATECLHAADGKPTDVKLLTSMMICNIIYGIVFARRFDYDNEMLHTIIKNLDMLFKQGGSLTVEGTIPTFLLKLFSTKAYKTRVIIRQALQWIKKHIYEEISNHESTFDNESIRDFIDLYLQAKNQHSDENVFNKGNMFRVIMDLFIAGSETTSNTINWCVLHMQEYPEIQKKCRDEIFENVGDRVVTWADRSALPYIEATLLEIQRMANIAPTSVPHTNSVDTTFRGYFIPRRTLILANLYSSHMDPRYWDQPDVFNPNRFIEGGKLKTNPALIPFSTGPRICLGDSLAKMEMFVIFTNLLQRFTFCREDDNVKHSFDSIPDQTVTLSPMPYKTRAVKRD